MKLIYTGFPLVRLLISFIYLFLKINLFERGRECPQPGGRGRERGGESQADSPLSHNHMELDLAALRS